MSLTGHVQNGVVIFDTSNALPDGTAVAVEVVEALPKSIMRQETASSALRDLAELAAKFPANPDWPADGAAQLEHYLYGAPKKP